MATPRLTTYRFRVWLGDSEDESAQTEYIVHGVGRDVQKAEALFADRKWGQTQDRPMTAAAATAYFGLLRSGRFEGSWDDFENAYLAVEPVEPVTAVPTGADPVPA